MAKPDRSRDDSRSVGSFDKMGAAIGWNSVEVPKEEAKYYSSSGHDSTAGRIAYKEGEESKSFMPGAAHVKVK